MASNTYKPKKSSSLMDYKLCTTLLFIILFAIPTLFLLRNPPSAIICTNHSTTATDHSDWSGNLRQATFAWNKLSLPQSAPPKTILKIAVFSRKWPIGSVPGGMERHAYTLHTTLAKRGHKVHVFTSPYSAKEIASAKQNKNVKGPADNTYPLIHCHEGEPGKWRYNKAWDQFVEENKKEPFDVVHSESVALPHWLARHLTNLVVTWHGIALESLFLFRPRKMKSAGCAFLRQ